MKKSYYLLLLLVVSMVTACTPKPEVVIFNDTVLETMIRNTMNIPKGDILVSDAEKVTRLELSIDWDPNKPKEEKIQTIDALKYFKNLELLDIQFHAIEDISPLLNLTKLHSLGLGGNQINDITVLSNLTELRFLSLFNCQAEDYQSLQNLTYLQTLFISYSKFEDLSVLTNLKDLNQLYIDHTMVSNLEPISKLNLTSLRLSGSLVSDYTPILNLIPNLKDKDFEIDQ